MVAKKTKKKGLLGKALDIMIGDTSKKKKKDGSGFRNANKQLKALEEERRKK